MKSKRKFIIIMLSISVFLLVFMIWIYPIILYSSPERVIRAFKTRMCVEDQISNPLIVCEKKIVPLLITEISDRNMKRRGHAIAALGQIGDTRALPTLTSILNDDTEKHLTRLEAIRSLAIIDISYAKKIARDFIDKKIPYFSDYCRKLIKDKLPKYELEKKSFWEAVMDRHE